MRTFLVDLWDKLRTSLWFVPTVMAVASGLLAFLLVRAQRYMPDDLVYRTRWLASGDTGAAREILSTIAGSIITVTGVIFSVTVVALSLASQQFGPRLLRNFMRDRGNQVVLGTFIGTFVYAMLVLRVVHEPGEKDSDVPYLAVTFAVGLAIISMGVLIYFIHHLVLSIQADSVVRNVSRELLGTINHLYPRMRDEPNDSQGELSDDASHDPTDAGHPVRSTETGYIRALDIDGLTKIAEVHDLVIRLIERPGKFVIKGMPIAFVHGGRAGHPATTKAAQHEIIDYILIGPTRTSDQDAEFSIAQLVEIAVRSLSPSLNDPFTAMSCLDRLGEALADIGARVLPKKERRYCQGRLRVIIDRPSYEGMVNLAFDQIRQNARRSPAVTIRMLEVIAMVMDRLGEWRDCLEPLAHQARMVGRVNEDEVPEERDRKAIAERCAAALARTNASAA